MKLINHRRNNNFYDIDNYVMRGTITMTRAEFQNAMEVLQRRLNRAIKECDTYIRDGLMSKSWIVEPKAKSLFSLGVVATKLIANQYGLKNHRKQNYGIQIL